MCKSHSSEAAVSQLGGSATPRSGVRCRPWGVSSQIDAGANPSAHWGLDPCIEGDDSSNMPKSQSYSVGY
jgi:hypothetical protein